MVLVGDTYEGAKAPTKGENAMQGKHTANNTTANVVIGIVGFALFLIPFFHMLNVVLALFGFYPVG